MDVESGVRRPADSSSSRNLQALGISGMVIDVCLRGSAAGQHNENAQMPCSFLVNFGEMFGADARYVYSLSYFVL